MDDDVVGRVERLALPLVGQDGDLAVVLVADHARGCRARRRAGGLRSRRCCRCVVAGVLRKYADVAVFFEPAHLAVVGNVAPDQVAARRRSRPALRPRASPVCSRWMACCRSCIWRSACRARRCRDRDSGPGCGRRIALGESGHGKRGGGQKGSSIHGGDASISRSRASMRESSASMLFWPVPAAARRGVRSAMSARPR